MKIRSSIDADHDAIHSLHLETFDESEAAEVAQLAVDLLNDATAEPRLSLVAEEEGRIVGHVVCSHVAIPGVAEEGLYILSPLAVSADHQNLGIGTRLMRTAFEALRCVDGRVLLVYGDPDYYGRVGFTADHNIQAPYELQYPHGWLAIELVPGALAEARGTIVCPQALQKPEMW